MNNDIMHETKTHGQLFFPFIVYRGMLPEYIDSYPLHWHEEFEIIYRLEKTGLQAIGYHENDAKIPWYWIGTKKGLNDMEWLK